MAELRMMQQNQQQLAAESDRARRHAEDGDRPAGRAGGASRKALADQRLLIEGMTDTVRTLREKSDDTNVRLSSITQELESIRQTIASQPQPVAVVPPADRSGSRSGSAGLAPAAPPAGTATADAAAERVAAAHLRHRVLRLHRRPVRARDRWISRRS